MQPRYRAAALPRNRMINAGSQGRKAATGLGLSTPNAVGDAPSPALALAQAAAYG